MWRHGRRKMDTQPGVVVLKYFIELARVGVEVVILPGNHDLDWEWLASGEVPKRYAKVKYPEGMLALMLELVAMPNVSVVKVLKLGSAVVVHGHEGLQGDWLWRMSEMGDRVTLHRFVGGQLRRKVMGGAPVGVRAAAVSLHGFYRRLAGWARRAGVSHVIHGHTHVHGTRVRGGVILDCLPAWRPSEGPGGGMLLREEFGSVLSVENRK